jgi:methionine-gamma-lyase
VPQEDEYPAGSGLRFFDGMLTEILVLVLPAMKNKTISFGTVCVHNKQQSSFGHSHMEAIFPTSTFSYDNPEQLMKLFQGTEPGYIYSRWDNPTFHYAADKISLLEAFELNNEHGNQLKLKTMLFSSGMGAISTLLMSCLKPGEKLITQGNLYGGTDEFIHKILKPLQIDCVMVDLNDTEKLSAILDTSTDIRMMYIETPANPTLSCYDLNTLAAIAKKYNLITAADNTFATPYLQQPFRYGVDYVVHSTTKFLNGHGNAIGGALVFHEDDDKQTRFHEVMKLLGNNANPFDSWLLSNGLKTLELRMQKHCENATQLAQFFSTHPAINKVNYPGLQSHPDHAICNKQMRHAGAMMSIELFGGLDASKEFIASLKLATLAVSLGTVDTIVQHPASMSHVKMSKAQREQYGILDGLIRISVGIEHIDDLIYDFSNALDKTRA